jgi:hypothetical protein
MEAKMKSMHIGSTASGAPANLFRILARRWHRHAGHLADPYRPERHYMRGPGPKSREKHDFSGKDLW